MSVFDVLYFFHFKLVVVISVSLIEAVRHSVTHELSAKPRVISVFVPCSGS